MFFDHNFLKTDYFLPKNTTNRFVSRFWVVWWHFSSIFSNYFQIYGEKCRVFDQNLMWDDHIITIVNEYKTMCRKSKNHKKIHKSKFDSFSRVCIVKGLYCDHFRKFSAFCKLFSSSHKESKFQFSSFIENMLFSIVKWCILNESQKLKLR